MASSLDLTGRVAVVIGGTSGLGRTIALGLAGAGADVGPTGGRAGLAAGVCEEGGALGRRPRHTHRRVPERESVDALRDRVLESFGDVDVLVYAAGTIVRRPTVQVPEDEWRSILDVNATGALRACQSFYCALSARHRGRVIHIVSLNSF